MKCIILGALAFALVAPLPAMAQTYRADAREWRQSERIYRGAVRGELTPRELRQLSRQQQRIDRVQRRAAADGVVTRAERREIERRQDRASKNIHRKTHNRRGGFEW